MPNSRPHSHASKYSGAPNPLAEAMAKNLEQKVKYDHNSNNSMTKNDLEMMASMDISEEEEK